MDVEGQKVDAGARPVSMRDVAQYAGVSYQTVSRVINDHASVRDDTRRRVREAIGVLGYRPNLAARALVSGRSDTLTVLTSDTSLYGYRSSLAGIEKAARDHGLQLTVTMLTSPEPAVVAATVERVSAPNAGSVVVIAFDAAGALALAEMPSTVPVAALVEPAFVRARTGIPPGWAWLDDRAVASLATGHLLALGHETVHHVPIPSGESVGERQAGWSEALVRAGRVVPPLVSEPGWDMAAGYRAGRAVAADPAVTAVLCGNDDLAIGMMRALGEAGLRVPDDVSIIGFDDSPHGAYLTPSLTTVRMDFAALGRRAVHLLYGRPGADLPQVPFPDLVVRESVGPPAATRRRSS